jgi:hypothetical protein
MKKKANTNSLDELNDPSIVSGLDAEKLQDAHERIITAKYFVEKEADEKGIALVRHYKPREKKITTRKPKSRESNMHLAAVELYNSLSKLTKNWYDVVDKINQYPPTDRVFDGNTAFKLKQFKKTIDNVNKFMQSLSDERYIFSLYEWVMIEIKENRQSEFELPFFTINSKVKHQLDKYYSGSKPIVMATDENGNAILDKKGKPVYRPMTHKNIKYRLEKKNEEISELINSVKEMSKILLTIMYELSKWRDDKSQFKNAIATRIIEAHPKLSESAVRYGGSESETTF